MNDEELELVRQAAGRMVKRAIALDGTCVYRFLDFDYWNQLATVGTGEHGVGRGKKRYLNEELGVGTVQLMKSIKRLIDPYNLFNPGKVSISRGSCMRLTQRETALSRRHDRPRVKASRIDKNLLLSS